MGNPSVESCEVAMLAQVIARSQPLRHAYNRSHISAAPLKFMRAVRENGRRIDRFATAGNRAKAWKKREAS
jgi:hypothetical protein